MDDDYDPLAAPVFVDEDPQEDVDDGGTGFSDGDRIVRVFTEDSQINRVRISPIWRRKLGSKRLEDCFGAAFAAARIRVAPARGGEPEVIDLSTVDFSGLPRFGKDPFATFRLAMDNLNQRWREAAARQQDAMSAQRPAPASGDSDGATVRLNEDGQAVSVQFDEDWLEDASPGEISSAVEKAASAAYRAHVPVERPRDEIDLLTREHEVLMAGFMSMISGRTR